MNKWKFLTLLFASLWLITGGYFVYSGIDQGYRYAYLNQSFSELSDSNAFLGSLVVNGAKEHSKKDVLHLLRQNSPEAFIVEDESSITLRNTTFHFKNDKLVRVMYQHGL